MATKNDFASLFEDATAGGGRSVRARLEAGMNVEGTVLEISGGLVVIDIGSGADATLDLMELHDRPLKVGDKIRAMVKNPRADGPELTLALGRGGAQVSSQVLELALAGGTPVTGTVSAAVKGGYSVDLAGTRAFCPISQIDLGFVNDPEVWVGQTLEFKVIEIKEGGRNVVVSRKALLEAQRKQAQSEALSTIQVGSTVSGVVRSTVKHGAVVDIGGVDGFIHVSELARSRVERPEDVVTVGETVEVKVLSVEQGERGPNIRLSLKALVSASDVAAEAPSLEEVLQGKVSGHVAAGIVVSTAKGDGFVPARELDLPPGADHKRAYPVGTELKIVVVHRDPGTGKLRFSMRKVADVEERKNFREFGGGGSGSAQGKMGSLGDLFAGRFGAPAGDVPKGSSGVRKSR